VTKHRKGFDRVFGVIVVPGHTVVSQKGEQLVSVFMDLSTFQWVILWSGPVERLV
jgi:hypothetical protein